MANIKNFNDFLGEGLETRGMGPGNKSFFDIEKKKQTVNGMNLDPIGNLLRTGHQIVTKNIDGIIRSVVGGKVLIEDRLSKEMKEYSIKEVMKEFTKQSKHEEEKKTYIEGSTVTPRWLQPQNIYESKQIKSITTENVDNEEEQDVSDDVDDEKKIEDDIPLAAKFGESVINEDLIGDVYNPGYEIDPDLIIPDDVLIKSEMDTDEEEKEEEQEEEIREFGDTPPFKIDRPSKEVEVDALYHGEEGTEDNPTGEYQIEGEESTIEQLDENWKEYWEKFAELEMRKINETLEVPEEDFPVDELNRLEVIENDEEELEDEFEEDEPNDKIPVVKGTEDNPNPSMFSDRFRILSEEEIPSELEDF